ncbi:MAG: UDP-glucose 4-epimerase GalE, partial [Vicinamibacteria bacterium]
LDDLSTGHRGALPPGVAFVAGSLLDRATVEGAIRDHSVSAVMHFAAACEVGESMSDPAKYYRNNVIGSLILAEAMLRDGVGRIVFSSSCSVYGEPASLPIEEDTPRRPTNTYGLTKKIFEDALADYQRSHGVRWASLRYFNAAGASAERGEDHEPESHIIPRVLRVAAGRLASLDVFGGDYPTPDGTCIRDYVHVEDLALAHVLALEGLESGSIEGRAYNLGNGAGYSVLDIIRTAEAVTGERVAHRIADRRPGDPPCLVASSKRIGSELGWRPAHADLRKIIESAWRWHSVHPRGYGEEGE